MRISPPQIRIFARYAVGASASLLVAVGMPAPLAAAMNTSPEVLDAVAWGMTAIVGAANEYWYARAKRKGGET